MTTIQMLGSIFGSVTTMLQTLQVPGFNITFYTVFVGLFAIASASFALKLVLNFGGAPASRADQRGVVSFYSAGGKKNGR